MFCQSRQSSRRGGVLPRPRRTQSQNRTTKRRPRTIPVGVDAHIDPAMRNHKSAHTIGDNAKCPVGADASVRPWGSGKFAAIFRKNDCALCGESAASTPTNVVRICRGTFVFAGAYRRADRVVRPYGCIPFRIGAFQICDGVPRGRGRTPPLRWFDSWVQT